MFALKLKKKLNETTAQLQSSEQEKANLKKLITDNDLEHKSKEIREEYVLDNPGTNEKDIQKSNSVELEVKVKNLTSDLEAATKVNEKVKQLEGILFSHCCVNAYLWLYLKLKGYCCNEKKNIDFSIFNFNQTL